jgi:HD-GYP domain-containing protein (c-di-GMP phosphodiesterase class II)
VIPAQHERRSQDGPRIALVDNTAERRQALVQMLKPYYRVTEYEHSGPALLGLIDDMPHAALVAEHVPPLGGYEVVRRIRDVAELKQLPIVLVVSENGKTAREGMRWCRADRLLEWPCYVSTALRVVSAMCNLHVQRRWEALSPEPRRALQQTLAAFNSVAEAIRRGRGIDLEQTNQACASLVTALNNDHFHTILDAVKDHDDYTYVHCLRVATYLSLFGHVTGLSLDNQFVLATGGLLHDVGKLRIPYAVLNKPGPLERDEFNVVKTHVQATVALLERTPDVRKPIITIASQHHEKLDGSGYPHGLSASDLDELARMAAIVDVFGALTDRRTYKAALDVEAALNLMLDEFFGKLDTRLLTIFRQAMLDAAVLSHRPLNYGDSALNWHCN